MNIDLNLKTDKKWDAQWEGWEKPSWPEYTSIRINWFRQTCNELLIKGQIRTNSTVVEVGAGTGWVTRELYHLFTEGSYICADVSSDALTKIDSLGFANVTTCLMNELELGGQRADIVICGDVYEHVEDRSLFFRQISKVLKPGGHLLLSTPNRFVPILFFRRLLGKEATGQPYDRPVDKSQLVRTFEDEGFQVITCELTNALKRPPEMGSTFFRKIVLKCILLVVAAGLWLRRQPMDDAILAHVRKLDN